MEWILANIRSKLVDLEENIEVRMEWILANIRSKLVSLEADMD